MKSKIIRTGLQIFYFQYSISIFRIPIFKSLWQGSTTPFIFHIFISKITVVYQLLTLNNSSLTINRIKRSFLNKIYEWILYHRIIFIYLLIDNYRPKTATLNGLINHLSAHLIIIAHPNELLG